MIFPSLLIATLSIASTAKDKSKELYLPIVKRAAKHHKIDWRLLEALVEQESGWNPHAVSKKGAKGIVQLMDATATSLGVNNPFNPNEAIYGAAKLLSYLNRKYRGVDELVLAAYNAGESRVDKCMCVPPFKETQNYVKKILENKRK